MRPEVSLASASNGWTLMLADVVALMLAFFVLSFSMREMVDGGRPAGDSQSVEHGQLIEGVPAGGGTILSEAAMPLSLSSPDGRVADQLRALEQAASDTPPVAYLAAIVQGVGPGTAPVGVRHDDTALLVELPEGPDDDAAPIATAARQLLLAMAFLARRFDLALAVALPADGGRSMAERVSQALLVRDWLAAVTGEVVPEVTFAASNAATAPGGGNGSGWALLLVKPAADGRPGGSP
jgi:hypothetical protein